MGKEQRGRLSEELGRGDVEAMVGQWNQEGVAAKSQLSGHRSPAFDWIDLWVRERP